jgi:hypothetical protein
VIASFLPFLFQYAFFTIFMVPTQGVFNALIYFRLFPTKQRSSSFCVPPFRQWGSFRGSLSRRRSAASNDPIETDVARAAQEEDLQDSEEEIPVVEQTARNGATEGSRILDPVEMELSLVPEANLEH